MSLKASTSSHACEAIISTCPINARHPPSDLLAAAKEPPTKQRAIVLPKMALNKHWTVQRPHSHSGGRPQSTSGLSDSIYTHEGNCLVSHPATKIQAISSKKAQAITMRSQRKKSHRASPSNVENAPRRKRMTPEQLDILNHYYTKNTRPMDHDIKLLAKEIRRPVSKVINWFNNRRAKERRLELESSLRVSPLSQSIVDSDVDMTESDDDGSESESGDAKGVLDQEARACVAAMGKMSPEEVDVAFILSNLKRRIIIQPPKKRQSDVFSSV